MGASASCTSGTVIGGKRLSESQIALIAASWEAAKEYGAENIGIILFKSLFVRAPETFGMFESFAELKDWESSPHFKHHCRVVVNIIGSFVKLLNNPQLLISHIEFLGLKHNLFNISPRHFEILGEDLLRIFEEKLGTEKFSAEAKAAWLIFYTIISKSMQDFMHDHSPVDVGGMTNAQHNKEADKKEDNEKDKSKETDEAVKKDGTRTPASVASSSE